MHRLIKLSLLLLISNIGYSQTRLEKFKSLFKANDTAEIKSLLGGWEKENPNDPEFYTCAFNYYFLNSKSEILSIDREQRGTENLQLTDSTGKVAGYFNSTWGYDPIKLQKAFTYITGGIQKFPSRLDMRFGKCHALQQVEDYQAFTTELINAIKYSIIIKNNWLWTEDKKVENPEDFMLNTVHSYLRELYDTENDNLLENIKQIGDTTLKYYPSSIKILSITAVANMLTKNYDMAIAYLKQAEKLDPKDFIVLNNIAHGYKLKGDKENAIRYYELAEKYGDEKAKKQAKKEIELLKNQH